jgi:hypothetical protein
MNGNKTKSFLGISLFFVLSIRCFGLTTAEYKQEITKIGNEMNTIQQKAILEYTPPLIRDLAPLWQRVKELDPPENLKENHQKLTEGYAAFEQSLKIQIEMAEIGKDPDWATKPENFVKLQDIQLRFQQLTPKMQAMQEALQAINSAQ